MDNWLYPIILVIAIVAMGKIISSLSHSRNRNRNRGSAQARNQIRNTPTQTQRPAAPRPAPQRPQPTQQSFGPVIYYANNPHNWHDRLFRFTYRYVPDAQTWRAYIDRMPDLNGRSGDLHITHRFTDSNGTYWVCWDTPIANLKDMQTVSKLWADNLLRYIATGQSFG